MSRDTFIDSAIAKGMTGEQINASLNRLKYDPLNRVEVQQINEGTYGLSFGQRAKKDIVDVGKGGATLLGEGLNMLLHPVKEGLPKLKQAGDYFNTSPSLMGDFTNLVLSPYNTSLGEIATQNPIETAKDIGAGVINHPVYAALDTLPITAPIVGKGIQKGIKALPEGKIKSSLRGFTDEGRQVNQILSESRASVADTVENLRNKSFRLQQYTPEDLAVAIKNIESPTKGAWVGTEQQLAITKELRDMVKETNDLLVKAGFNPETMKTSAVNQYIVRNLDGDIPLATVEKALKDKKFALDNGLEIQKLKQLEQEGTDLYNKNLIQPFKHSTDADMAREGLVDEAVKKERSADAKLYGTQNYEDLARGFIKDGYTSTINKLRTTEGAMGAIKAMADEVGRKVEPQYTTKVTDKLRKLTDQEYIDATTDLFWKWMNENNWELLELGLTKDDVKFFVKNKGMKFRLNGKVTTSENKIPHELHRLGGSFDYLSSHKRPFEHWLEKEGITNLGKILETTTKKTLHELPPLKSNEVYVSPKLLNEKFGTSIANGEDILGDINSLSRGLNKAEIAKYADDLYVFNKEDIEALKKAYNPRSGVLGNLGSIAKMGVLATPRYIAGNAMTNMLIAPMTGVTVRDILYTKLNEDKLPRLLRRTSSYSGYLGEKLPINASYKDVYQQLTKDIGEGDWSTKLQAINMAANYPIFKGAQSIESFQRSVEFVNQAKKYAQENGKTIEQVLAEARKNGGNNKTFREINFRVQKYYGDYLGRNYYAPNWTQTALELSAPFYRPLTQGVRQFYNASKDLPLETQMFYRQPSIAMNNYAQQLADESGTERDPIYGGFPIQERSGRLAGQVIYSPYHAFSPVSELVADPMGTLTGNTFATSMINPILGRNKFGDKVKLPNAMESFDGNLVLLDNNGNPTGIQLDNNVEARLRGIPAQYIQQFLSPVTQANSYILPALAAFTGQQYTAPADTSVLGQVGDLKVPFVMESNIGARRKSTPEELLLPLLGATVKNTYKEPTGEVVGKNYRRYGSEMRKRLNRLEWER